MSVETMRLLMTASDFDAVVARIRRRIRMVPDGGSIERDLNALTQENIDLREALKDVIDGMRTWGSWEDGVPEAGDNEFGRVGAAYDRGCELLGMPRKQDSDAVRKRGE